MIFVNRKREKYIRWNVTFYISFACIQAIIMYSRVHTHTHVYTRIHYVY